jgi:hypothetical protein
MSTIPDRRQERVETVCFAGRARPERLAEYRERHELEVEMNADA